MKQQEYQEALDFFTIGRIFAEEEAEDMYEMRYRLAELIDKLPYWLELEKRDKPMKVIWGSDGEMLCPSCREPMEDYYAWVSSCCYQRLDWSDEE